MMSDVQFRCKGGVLQPAHRCILHARAPLLLDLVGPDGSAGRGGAGWKGVSPVRCEGAIERQDKAVVASDLAVDGPEDGLADLACSRHHVNGLQGKNDARRRHHRLWPTRRCWEQKGR